jgi:hypothetical protein
MRLKKIVKLILSSRGVALVEFSISFPLFIMSVLTCIDCALMIQEKTTLDNAITSAGRGGVVSVVKADTSSVNSSIKFFAEDLCEKYSINPPLYNTCISIIENLKASGVDISELEDEDSNRDLIDDKTFSTEAKHAILLKVHTLVTANSEDIDCSSILININWRLKSLPGSIFGLGFNSMRTVKRRFCFPVESSLNNPYCSPLAMQSDCLRS